MRRIILIRHGEKPNGTESGVLPDGKSDEKSLTVRGWQRAGALALYFASPEHRPGLLFASHSSSSRPRQTLEPLSEKLGIPIDLSFGKDEEAGLAAAATNEAGIVLICWQHEYMTAVADAILGDNTTAPREWPSDRFDVNWVFDLDERTGRYRFSQEPQRLLARDSASTL